MVTPQDRQPFQLQRKVAETTGGDGCVSTYNILPKKIGGGEK